MSAFSEIHNQVLGVGEKDQHQIQEQMVSNFQKKIIACDILYTDQPFKVGWLCWRPFEICDSSVEF